MTGHVIYKKEFRQGYWHFKIKMLRGGVVKELLWVDNVAPFNDGNSGQYCPLNCCISFDIEKYNVGSTEVNRAVRVKRNHSYRDLRPKNNEYTDEQLFELYAEEEKKQKIFSENYDF